MPLDPEGRRRRARDAALSRHHPDPVEPRRRLKADAATRYLRKLVSEDPQLTIEQRMGLAVLLLDPSAGDAA